MTFETLIEASNITIDGNREVSDITVHWELELETRKWGVKELCPSILRLEGWITNEDGSGHSISDFEVETEIDIDDGVMCPKYIDITDDKIYIW